MISRLPSSPSASSPCLFAGTSGWAYPSWKPAFYPQGVSAKKFLGFYASQLTSVEINYTFSSALKPGQLQGWLDQTPPRFRFSFKAPQRITHFSRLRDCDTLVQDFVDSLEPAVAAGKFGVILFQLPPSFRADLPRLRRFLAAPVLRASTAPRIALEFRHESWFTDEASSVLREHNAALCIAESDELKTPEVHAALDHTCFRLRRNGGYTPAEIRAFAQRFIALAQQRDVYVYFKHEEAATGALNAAALLRAVQGEDSAQPSEEAE